MQQVKIRIIREINDNPEYKDMTIADKMAMVNQKLDYEKVHHHLISQIR